jgi:ABC-2 type transport system permease protein
MRIQCPRHGHTADTRALTLLTVLLGSPIAFFSIWGRGYLVPLGILVLTVVFSQIIAALGYGHYFPWAVPALFSGASGEYKEQLNAMSYFILVVVAVAGYCVTIFYWKYADHHR